MKKDRRWMKSVLAASVEQAVTLPWQRATRTRPGSLKSTPVAPRRAMAAR